MKIGVITDCLGLPLRDAVTAASELGVKGVQIYATTGEFSPSTLDDNDISEFKRFAASKGLTVSALCGDMGGHGFEIEKDNALRVQKTKEIIDLAQKLGVSIITTHIGVIPSDKTEPRYAVMLEALTECGLYAKEKGVTLAIETGPEKAVALKAFLDDTKGGVGVNLDPANFVMVTDQDPVEAVHVLKDYIVHTHAKDGKMLKKTDPRTIYNVFADGGIESLNVADYFIETPLGAGDVDFAAYISALKEIGYDGFLTIERETGADPMADIKAAVDYLNGIIRSV